VEKNEKIWVKVTLEQKGKIKALAQEEGCSVSDYVIHKILNIPLQEVGEKIYTRSQRYQPIRKKVLNYE